MKLEMIRVYLDNCCYNRPYDDQEFLAIRLETEVKLMIQSKIKEKKLELVWSYILDFENEANPDEDVKFRISQWKDLSIIQQVATSTIIKHEGFNAIFKQLDIVEAERFITLIKREKFDYTNWRKTNLPKFSSIDELSNKAMENWNKKND